jgi:spermidine synthase
MATAGNRRAPLHAVLGGFAVELRPDPVRAEAWTLLVDGVPQSHVDLADPEHLELPYQRRIGTVLRGWARDHVRGRILHLGGGGLTLARLLHHLRPGVAQEVVEHDPDLVALVSRLLPFPEAIDVRVGDARTELDRAGAGRYDVIISDVYVGAVMPPSVGTDGFARAAAGALKPDGLLVVNLTDVPPLAHARSQAATAGAAFTDVALFAPVPVLRGRRAGNVILLAGNVPMIKSDRHAGVLRGNDLTISPAAHGRSSTSPPEHPPVG